SSLVSYICWFFFSSRRRHTRSKRDWSSDVCSSDLPLVSRDGRCGSSVALSLGESEPRSCGDPVGRPTLSDGLSRDDCQARRKRKIGRASCRERAYIAVVEEAVEKKKTCALQAA